MGTRIKITAIMIALLFTEGTYAKGPTGTGSHGGGTSGKATQPSSSPQSKPSNSGSSNATQQPPNGPSNSGFSGQSGCQCNPSIGTVVCSDQYPPIRCDCYSGATSCQQIGYNEPGFWPPNQGCAGPETRITLPTGTRICRFGNPNGNFAAPEGQSFPENALPPISFGERNCWELNCSMDVWTCRIAPWFGQPGGGIQYRFEQQIGTQECLRRFLHEEKQEVKIQ